MVHAKLWLAALIVAVAALAIGHQTVQAQEEPAPAPVNDCCDPVETPPE